MSNKIKTLILWMLLFGMAIYLAVYYGNQKKTPQVISFSEFMAAVNKGAVQEVVILDDQKKVEGKFNTPQPNEFMAFIGSDPEMWKTLREKNVKVTIKPPEQVPMWLSILVNVGPFLILGLIIFIVWRQMQGAGNSAFNFAKSRAKLFSSNQTKVTFEDVAGVEEAKEELKEVIDFLKEPTKFQKLGGKIPKGVLLIGSPGTGKTLLARAVAGEAGVPFFSLSGSDFVEMFVGVGAARVRDLFEQGKKNAPCIIFIDELDAVGRKRGSGMGGGHDEREQTLNALLVEMDGFETNTGLIVVSATNRVDVLDSALLRPGRFDRRVVVALPDYRGREAIMKIHTKKVPLDKDVDLSIIARGTPGFTGADLANLINEASLLAARNNKKEISLKELENAKDKIYMGVERKSLVISDKEKRNTAFHEAGHALIANLMPGTDPLHKVTIIPRGVAMGVTWRLPNEDRHSRGKKEFITDIMISLGGRIAEELFMEDISTGASADFQHVTEVAHKMVTFYGMSEKLGTRTYGRPDREIFIGGSYMQEKDYSEDTSKKIDEEVRNIIEGCYIKAKKLLTKNRAKLEKIALALLERESLDGAEVEAIISGKNRTPVAPPAPPVSGNTVEAVTAEKKEKVRQDLKPSPAPNTDAEKA
ncbi:MAG: ATP-dependent zinc metalloprotease FtsH [Candidatus Firestonebacteria bacterium]|nr:ATP-dependent zinc metalloprotease FtsH [Candidatus Firestonebacteria bacterium]